LLHGLSTARLRLGDKALITVRERSVLTIREAPGVSTFDVASGRMGIAVVKERVRPGEVIDSTITVLRGRVEESGVCRHRRAGRRGPLRL